MSTDVLFSERQRFKLYWIWIPFLVVDLLFLLGVFVQLVLGRSFGSKPMSNTGLLLATALLLLFTIFMMSFSLETKIKGDGIYVRLFPFYRTPKKYLWGLISKSFVRKYDPWKEFGGWGIRTGHSGKAWIASGDHGIQLVFTNGTSLLIGTGKPEEAEKALLQSGHLSQWPGSG
jgi:hypothetical protein